MLRIIAILFGIGFIFIGVAGFIPSSYVGHYLFGYFLVNFIQNMIYIISGVLAIMSATRTDRARFFLRGLGLVYAILALLGFALDGNLSFLMFETNLADNILHLVIALAALYVGFYAKRR